MQTKNNKMFLYPLLLTLLLSGAACNLAKVAADDDSANTRPEPMISNSNADDSAAAATDSTGIKAPELTPQTVAGTYRYKTYKPNKGGYDNTLEITDKGGGKLHVKLSGSNAWMNDGEETMHEAGGEGDAQLGGGGTATARITPDGDDRPCRVTLNFTANQVRVATAKNCTFNISLDGLYTREKTAPTSAATQTKDGANPKADLQKVSFEKLRDFVEDHQKNKTGKRFVITEVPAAKISKTSRADANGSRNLKGLYYFQTDDDDTDVSTTFVGSAALYKDYVAKVEHEPSKLRVTAVLVEFLGEFDVYRSSFVTKIEGLDDNGKVVWTISGTEPAKVSFRQ